MSRFVRHVFVCENVRDPSDPKGCCAAKGSKELRERFKELIKTYELRGKVRANSSGCMDACEFGPTVVVYPEATWYGGVKIDDVEEIVREHLVGGRPVERLLVKKFNKP